MPRDTRTYITVHDGMPEHPKIDPLSDAAFRLLVDTWCWCARNKTDGKVNAATWVKRGSVKARRELFAAGLVEAIDGGVLVHDYLEHQRSRDEIAELREKRQKAGSKGGKARANAKASAKQPPQQKAGKTVADIEDPFQGSTNHSPTSLGSSSVPAGSVARIVKAYADAARSAEMPAPKESQAKVDRTARSLLEQGYDLDVIEQAAVAAARGGWTDLAMQMQRNAAQGRPESAGGRESTTDRRAQAAIDAGRAVQAEMDRRAIG